MEQRTWGHDELASDLAIHLHGPGRMVWENLQLGPSGSIRPDVYTVERSFVRPAPVAYECKVTRSDLLSDLTSGKWIAYERVASAVYFAVPLGLATRSDIPKGVGLYVRSESGWSALRRATRGKFELDKDLLLKLLIDGLDLAHGTTWRYGRSRLAREWRTEAQSRARLAARVAAFLRAEDESLSAVERAKQLARAIEESARVNAKRYTQDALAELRTFASEVGIELPEDATATWGWGRGFRQRLDELNADRVARLAERDLDQIIKTLGMLRDAVKATP